MCFIGSSPVLSKIVKISPINLQLRFDLCRVIVSKVVFPGSITLRERGFLLANSCWHCKCAKATSNLLLLHCDLAKAILVYFLVPLGSYGQCQTQETLFFSWKGCGVRWDVENNLRKTWDWSFCAIVWFVCKEMNLRCNEGMKRFSLCWRLISYKLLPPVKPFQRLLISGFVLLGGLSLSM